MDGPKKIKIVLLGKTGSGKSSAGNVILGKEKFKVSCRLNSATQDCERETVIFNEQEITVIDTPGIFDTEKSEKDQKDSIISCLVECAPGPHAFILVLRLGRYTKEEEESVRKILEWFGEEVLRYTVILFTHGDELDKNMTIEEYIKVHDPEETCDRNQKDKKKNVLKELVEKCEGRVHVIDCKYWNKKDEGQNAQSADLLDQTRKLMIKDDAGQAMEAVKNLLSEQRSSTSDQEPGQGSGRPGSIDGSLDDAEYRSNGFQIKQLLTTIEKMVQKNEGKHYTNESLWVTAEAIETEVRNIEEELKETNKNADMTEIKRRARERVRTKTRRLVAGGTTGALLGALLGVGVGISIVPVWVAGFLMARVHAKTQAKMANTAAGVVHAAIGTAAVIGTEMGAVAGAVRALGAEAGAVGVLGAAAVGVAGAEVGAVGAGAAGAEAGVVGVLGAGAITGIGLGVAAGVLAAVGAVGGGVEGVKAAARADKPKDSAENAAEAVRNKAGNIIKQAWVFCQKPAK